MRILVLSFYYPPDLSAGSFRIAAFVKTLQKKLTAGDLIDVVTTMPNRYRSFQVRTPDTEVLENVTITRCSIPPHKSGFLDQARAYLVYFRKVLVFVNGQRYDAVFATSSRLLTAFLAAVISRQKRIPLYLDIRDIFVDTMQPILKKKKLSFLLPFFNVLEQFTIRRAWKVNLISPGFQSYFSSRYPKKPFSFFTHGIDDEFLAFVLESREAHRRSKKLLYAGNIGEGQGLENIIPQIALRFPDIEITIIGDGSCRHVLEERLKGLKNIRLEKPVKRSQLIDFYRQADCLFLHLNDYEPFKKVLPSKIFEYAATYKPIIAGVSGYAKDFLERHLPDCLIFRPCDIEDFCDKFHAFAWTVHLSHRKSFIEQFMRREIMDRMGDDFLSMISGGNGQCESLLPGQTVLSGSPSAQSY